jgi:dTDP-4-amino-4,6-dideoxygalactose transaminase
LPQSPEFSENNAHMFYISFDSLKKRSNCIKKLKENEIHAVFHYISLHSSPYYKSKHDGRVLVNSDKFTDTLLRLPLYYELNEKEIDKIVGCF